MDSNDSLLENLKKRRVLPLVGMYVAASWLVIELGDWVTERFNLPGNLTSYIFVAMVVMLPAVALFAYNHGAPGKDKWTRTERIVVPLNVLLAIGVIYLINPVLDVEAATETVQIPDETGALQEFEVARQGYHREIIGFYWSNETGDESLDWLSYALPIMLAYDLNRVSPVITAVTPTDSVSIRDKLREQGVDELVDVPRGLAVQISRDRRSAALVVGSFDSSEDVVTVTASVIESGSGEVLGTRTVTSDDWFAAVDEITATVLDLVDVVPADNQSDDPISQHFSDSIDAVRYFANGHLAIDLDNDYPRGITELQSALEVDPAFAEAHRALSIAQYLSGDIESARVSANQALRNGYRLSDAGKFILRANRYIFDGDFARGERVLEMWTEVQPNSTRAFGALARLLKIRGGDEALNKATDAYERMLELDPNDFSVYLKKAEVEQQRGDYDAAANFVRLYLDAVPDSGDAYLQLSNIHQAAGALDAAQKALEDAAILSDNPVESEVGLARLEARRGLYDDANARLDALLGEELTPPQKLQVLTGKTEFAVALGQIEKAIDLVDESSQVARVMLPPAFRLVSVEGQKANLLALKGRIDEAVAFTDSLAKELQPPVVWYLNFTYSSIYDSAGDREKYREWAGKTQEIQRQLPDVFQPFVALETAQLAIWDGDTDGAVELLDAAMSQFGQSFLQLAQNNLNVTSFYIGFAELYLDTGAIDKAKRILEDIIKVFPSSGHAKLVLAKASLAERDEDTARQLLERVIDIWSGADEDFTYLAEARSALEGGV